MTEDQKDEIRALIREVLDEPGRPFGAAGRRVAMFGVGETAVLRAKRGGMRAALSADGLVVDHAPDAAA